MALHLSLKLKDTLSNLNFTNECLKIKFVSFTSLSMIRQLSFPKYKKKHYGGNFSQCGEYNRLKLLKASLMSNLVQRACGI